MPGLLVCMAVVIGLAGLGGSADRAHAEPAPQGDAVALLPLDAERNLEIYGQPVASEIARALVAGDVAVVVVGPKMAVPERARLIIDGTISLGKASAVTISLRIRNTVDGVTLENLSAAAPGLAKIDAAASELSARLLPIVRDRLAALRRSSADHGRVELRSPVAAPARPIWVLVTDLQRTRSQAPGHLLAALDAAVASFCRAGHREIQKLDPTRLAATRLAATRLAATRLAATRLAATRLAATRLAAPTVASLGADLAIGFWILDYASEDGTPPMARARVRVQIASGRTVVFDRVVVTDTVVGDVGLLPNRLAERVAREILAIVRPHMRRSVPSWP